MEPNGESQEPKRSIGRVGGAYDGHPSVADLEECTAHAGGGQRSSVKVLTLNEQVRAGELAPAREKLRPEPTASKRTMKIGDGLSLDTDSVSDEIVGGCKPHHFDCSAQFAKVFWDPRRHLARVSDYLHGGVRHANRGWPRINHR